MGKYIKGEKQKNRGMEAEIQVGRELKQGTTKAKRQEQKGSATYGFFFTLSLC